MRIQAVTGVFRRSVQKSFFGKMACEKKPDPRFGVFRHSAEFDKIDRRCDGKKIWGKKMSPRIAIFLPQIFLPKMGAYGLAFHPRQGQCQQFSQRNGKLPPCEARSFCQQPKLGNEPR
jgi:hypothetical protein